MKHYILATALFFLAVAAVAQPRFDVIRMPLCWTVGSVDSSITRYVLVSSTGAYSTVLYLDAAGQEIIYTGGTLRNGHCDCCQGGGGEQLTYLNALTRSNDTVTWEGPLYKNTLVTGGAFKTTFTGTNPQEVFLASNTLGNGHAIRATATGFGAAIVGLNTGSGNGILGQTVNGSYGVRGEGVVSGVYGTGNAGGQFFGSLTGVFGGNTSNNGLGGWFNYGANNMLGLIPRAALFSHQPTGNTTNGVGTKVGFNAKAGTDIREMGNIGFNFLDVNEPPSYRYFVELDTQTPLEIFSNGLTKFGRYGTNQNIGTGWARAVFGNDGTIYADTTSTTGGGPAVASIYTDTGTVAPIADFLVRTRPDTTFAIGECIGCTGFEDFWNNYPTPGTKFTGIYNSLSYWNGLGFGIYDPDSSVYNSVEVTNNGALLLSERAVYTFYRRAGVFSNTPLNGNRNETGIFIDGAYGNLDTYYYKLPDTNPSTTLNQKSIPVWTGNGAGFAVPAFEPYVPATWLKPEWETGNVRINADTNQLQIRIHNRFEPTDITPAIQFRHGNIGDPAYYTSIEQRDTVTGGYARQQYHDNQFAFESNRPLAVTTSDTTLGATLRSLNTSATVKHGIGLELSPRKPGQAAALVMRTGTNQALTIRPDSNSTTYTMSLPPVQGAPGQFLQAGSGGTTTWANLNIPPQMMTVYRGGTSSYTTSVLGDTTNAVVQFNNQLVPTGGFTYTTSGPRNDTGAEISAHITANVTINNSPDYFFLQLYIDDEPVPIYQGATGVNGETGYVSISLQASMLVPSGATVRMRIHSSDNNTVTILNPSISIHRI